MSGVPVAMVDQAANSGAEVNEKPLGGSEEELEMQKPFSCLDAGQAQPRLFSVLWPKPFCLLVIFGLPVSLDSMTYCAMQRLALHMYRPRMLPRRGKELDQF